MVDGIVENHLEILVKDVAIQRRDDEFRGFALIHWFLQHAFHEFHFCFFPFAGDGYRTAKNH